MDGMYVDNCTINVRNGDLASFETTLLEIKYIACKIVKNTAVLVVR